MSGEGGPMPTYGDISAKTAAHVTRRLLIDARAPLVLSSLKATRYSRFKRQFRWRLWRWRIADALRELANRIEP